MLRKSGQRLNSALLIVASLGLAGWWAMMVIPKLQGAHSEPAMIVKIRDRSSPVVGEVVLLGKERTAIEGRYIGNESAPWRGLLHEGDFVKVYVNPNDSSDALLATWYQLYGMPLLGLIGLALAIFLLLRPSKVQKPAYDP